MRRLSDYLFFSSKHVQFEFLKIAAAPLLIASFICAILLLLNSSPAQAQLDGLSAIGHSYQSDARGGCETSIGDTGLSHVRQPASVVLQGKSKFDSKLTNIFVLQNSWSNPVLESRSRVNNLFAYNLGAIQKLKENLALGVAWETGGWHTSFRNLPLSGQLGRQVNNSVAFKTYSTTLNLGYKLADKWFFGAGPHLKVMSLATGLPLNGALLEWPKSWSVGAGYQLGVVYHPVKKVSIGASYSSPTYMSKLSANVKVKKAGNLTSTHKAAISKVTLPSRVNLGIAYKPSDKTKMAVEGAYLTYGNSLLGSARINNLPTPASFDPGFQNFWVLNLGADHDFNRFLSGSIGYVFNSKPVSAKEMVPFYAANAQNQFTWGLRLNSGRFWTGFAHIIGLPALTRSYGSSHRSLGLAYPNSTVRQTLMSFNCGLGFSY